MMDEQDGSNASTGKFWILLILTVPAAIYSILSLTYMIYRRERISIHLHLNVVLITISFLQIMFDFPFALYFYFRGYVPFHVEAFCVWWNLLDYSIGGSLIYVMAWGSIERHFIVFHHSLFTNYRRQLIFHFIPMLSAALYPVFFYTYAIGLNSCENRWTYDLVSFFSYRILYYIAYFYILFFSLPSYFAYNHVFFSISQP